MVLVDHESVSVLLRRMLMRVAMRHRTFPAIMRVLVVRIVEMPVPVKRGLMAMYQFAATRLLLRSSEVVKDRAARPIVALAVVRKVFERPGHRLHLGDLRAQLVNVIERHGLDLRTGPLTILPELDELGDPFDREAQVAGPPYEAKDMDIGGAVDAVARFGSRCLAD